MALRLRAGTDAEISGWIAANMGRLGSAFSSVPRWCGPLYVESASLVVLSSPSRGFMRNCGIEDGRALEAHLTCRQGDVRSGAYQAALRALGFHLARGEGTAPAVRDGSGWIREYSGCLVLDEWPALAETEGQGARSAHERLEAAAAWKKILQRSSLSGRAEGAP